MQTDEILPTLAAMQGAIEKTTAELLATQRLVQQSLAAVVLTQRDPRRALAQIRSATLDSIESDRYGAGDDALSMTVRAEVREVIARLLSEIEAALPD